MGNWFSKTQLEQSSEVAGQLGRGSTEQQDVGSAEGVDNATTSESSLRLEIPPELLTAIFGKLAQNGTGVDLVEVKNSLLNCRLVSSEWHSVLIPFLEFQCLEHWRRTTVLSKHPMDSDHPLNLCRILVKPTPEYGPHTLLFCPPQIIEIGPESNPFPTKSLKLSLFKKGSTNHPEAASVVTNIVNFFDEFGKHLTSLVLTELWLSPETLQGILKHTPHLIALTLYKIAVRVDCPDIRATLSNSTRFCDLYTPPPLSPLPQLRHLRHVITSGFEAEEENDQFYIREWIVGSFQEQLVTLDVDESWDLDEVVGKSAPNFINLQRLTVWCQDNYGYLRQPEKFPKLECFSLIPFVGYIEGLESLDFLQWLLTPFAAQFLELNLYLMAETCVDGKKKHGKYISKENFEPMKSFGNEWPKVFSWVNNGVVFSKLKRLALFTEMFETEEEAVKGMLKCMPHLEILHLVIERSVGQPPRQNEIEDGEKVFNNVLGWDWRCCPKLKQITLRYGHSLKDIFRVENLSQTP